MRRKHLLFIAVLSLCDSETQAFAWGIPIQQTADQLGLKYKISAVASGDDVLVRLEISDLGAMKPLSGVTLNITKGKQILVYAPLSTKEDGGKIMVSAQLGRDMANDARIDLVPVSPPDGGQVFGWTFFSIPIDHITSATK